VIELLKKNNIKIYRTDRDGTVAIISDGDQYKILRERGSLGERFAFVILQLKELVSGGF
jgi:beta-lactamase superfamily II metal-dependent hydrolase